MELKHLSFPLILQEPSITAASRDMNGSKIKEKDVSWLAVHTWNKVSAAESLVSKKKSQCLLDN